VRCRTLLDSRIQVAGAADQAAGGLWHRELPTTRVREDERRRGPEECVDAPLAFRAPWGGEADGSSAPPAQVDDDRPVVGRVDAIDRLSTDVNARDDHELTLSACTKEDVVNAPIDQLGAGLKWRGRM
jgi:hypothetical protein